MKHSVQGLRILSSLATVSLFRFVDGVFSALAGCARLANS
jgi:hypothetical protein